MNVRVATRGSALALTQTNQLVTLLKERNPDCTFEIITHTTTGDKVTDRPLSQFRGTGVFVKELEKALLAGEADLAVHSLKDVPVERVAGLILAAFPVRVNPCDLLVTKTGLRFEELPQGAIVGTSSPRRMVQFKSSRPDLVFKDLRGNVDTRLRKLDQGEYTGIIAAAAGMLRLGRSVEHAVVLPMELCLPAAGQGCLAIECREADDRIKRIAATVDDAASRCEVLAERDFLSAVGGGCQTPIAVYAKLSGHELHLQAVIGDPESGRVVRSALSVPQEKSDQAGKTLAATMLDLCNKNNIRI